MRKNVAKTKARFVPSAGASSRGDAGAVRPDPVRTAPSMRSKAINALLNLAAAAVIAQSAVMPAWGTHLLSCGFTHALRTIQSAETLKAAAEKSRLHQRASLPQDVI